MLGTRVGVTSPPVASINNDAPRFCSAAVFCHLDDMPNDGNQVLETIPRFDLPHACCTVATSFLTNGVGATSPPVLHAFTVVNPLDFNDIASGNSTSLISSIALGPTVRRTLFSSNSLATETRLKSRLHSFATTLLLPSDRQHWSPCRANHLYII